MRSLVRSQVVDNLPMILTVFLAVVGVYFYGKPEQALSLVLGGIAGGLVDQDHRLTGRLTNLGFTLLAFTFSSLSVQWGLHLGYGFAPVIAGLTFGFTMLGAAGSRYRTVAFGTLAVATYTSLTEHAGQPWGENSLLILVGTLLYSLISLVVYAFFPHRPVREQLSGALMALANYIGIKSRFYDPDEVMNLEHLRMDFAMQNAEVIAHFNDCRRVLNYRLARPTPQQHTLDLTQLYFAMQDIHERISSTYIDYQQLSERWNRTDLPFRLVKLVAQQAQFCRTVTDYLWSGASLTPLAQALQRREALTLEAWRWHMDREEQPADLQGMTRLLENLTEIDRQLVSLSLVPLPRPDLTIAVHEDESFLAALQALRQNFGVHSPTFRHAVRLTVAVTLSCLIALVFKSPLGFWIMLTALFVCQPSYTATRSKITQRVLGTILGTLVGSVVPVLIPSYEGKLLVIALSITLFFWFRSVRYSSSTFFITVEALTALSLAGMPVEEALLPRITDTLVGSLLAWLAVSFMWPDWLWINIRQSASQALEALSSYLSAIELELLHGRQDKLEYRLARRRAYGAAAELGQVTKEMQASARQYGLQAEQGAKLLTLTYGLLGPLASLGAYRQQGHCSLSAETAALVEETATLMHALPGLSTSEFCQQQAHLVERAEALASDPLMRQQLLTILKLLIPFQATLSEVKPL